MKHHAENSCIVDSVQIIFNMSYIAFMGMEKCPKSTYREGASLENRYTQN